MSVTSQIAGAIGSLNSVSSILFGNGSPLYLGSFAFQSFEVPQNISYGGKNIIREHTLSGGRRSFDIMGTNEKNMSWSGILLSADAQDRARQLDSMRVQCDVISLTFGDYYRQVIIDEISFKFNQANHITYEISVIVLDNLSSDDGNDDDLDDSVNSDLNAADDVIIDPGDFADAIGDALADPLALLPISGLSIGSGLSQSVLTTMQAASTAVASVSAAATGAIVALGGEPVIGGGVAAALFLNSAASLANQATQINQVANYIGRATNNLS